MGTRLPDCRNSFTPDLRHQRPSQGLGTWGWEHGGCAPVTHVCSLSRKPMRIERSEKGMVIKHGKMKLLDPQTH